MVIHRLLSVRQVLWRMTTKPAVSRKVGHAAACVLGDSVILYLMVDMRISSYKLNFMYVDFIVC